MRQGTEGKSDNLLVSHFGLARGGSVSRLDLDPSPRSTYPLAALPPLPSSLRARGGGEWDYSSGRNRPKPTLKSTWSGPLLWPNEVNQVRQGILRHCDYQAMPMYPDMSAGQGWTPLSVPDPPPMRTRCLYPVLWLQLSSALFVLVFCTSLTLGGGVDGHCR